MLPDYIIYDELRRRSELEEADRNRPYLEVPQYIPYWPEPETNEDQEEEDRDRNVIIIQM